MKPKPAPPPERAAPSIHQAKRALAMMPGETPRQTRDKAIFALLCLTGIRVEALTSLKIKHLDLDKIRHSKPTRGGHQVRQANRHVLRQGLR